MSDAEVQKLRDENKRLRSLLKRWYWGTVTDEPEETVAELEAVARATRRALGKDRFNTP